MSFLLLLLLLFRPDLPLRLDFFVLDLLDLLDFYLFLPELLMLLPLRLLFIELMLPLRLKLLLRPLEL